MNGLNSYDKNDSKYPLAPISDPMRSKVNVTAAVEVKSCEQHTL